MRIAICGPEATGKTTLAAALAERLGLDILADPRGTGADFRGYHTAFELAKVHPYWRELVEAQLEREAEWAQGVIDVCALDAWALFVRWGWNRETPEAVERLAERVRLTVSTYSHVIVMPAQQVAPFAGHRFLNDSHARMMHRLAKDWLNRFDGAPVCLLVPGPESELLDQALAHCGG